MAKQRSWPSPSPTRPCALSRRHRTRSSNRARRPQGEPRNPERCGLDSSRRTSRLAARPRSSAGRPGSANRKRRQAAGSGTLSRAPICWCSRGLRWSGVQGTPACVREGLAKQSARPWYFSFAPGRPAVFWNFLFAHCAYSDRPTRVRFFTVFKLFVTLPRHLMEAKAIDSVGCRAVVSAQSNVAYHILCRRVL